MNSIDIVLTLVFSLVMLLFMSFPAMKVAEFLEERFNIERRYNHYLVIFFTILFSLMIGIF